MAVQVGSLFASYTLDASGFMRGLAQAERATASSMGNIQRQAGLTSRAVSGISHSFNQPIRPYSLIAVSRAFDNTADRANLLRGSLIAVTGVFGGFAAALSTNVILRYADTYTQLNNQLRVVSDSSADLKAQFGALDDVATRSRSGLKETVILYSRLSKAAPDLDPEKVVRYVETIQKSLQLGGATAQEAASAAVQFSQAIASNRLGGEELRAILETPLGSQLAKGLGVTIGQLRKLGTEGKLTANVLFGALERIGAGIDTQFANSVQTLDQAITLADNRFIAYVGSVNEAYGVTNILGKAIVGLADNLESIGSVVGTIAPIIGSIFAGRLLGGPLNRAQASIAGGFKNIGSAAKQGVSIAREEVTALERQTSEANRAVGDFYQKLQTTPKAQFADKSTVKALKTDIAELTKVEEKQLAVRRQIAESYGRVATLNGRVTPQILSATNAVADAESKLNALLAKQKELRNSVRANKDKQARTAVAAQGNPTRGNQAKVNAAERESLKLKQEILKTEEQLGRARDSLNQRLAATDAAYNAAARTNASERIAALNALNKLTAEGAALDERRASLLKRISVGVGTRDQQALAAINKELSTVVNRSVQVQQALAGARMRFAAATAAASGLSQAFSLVGRAGASLFSFLGGPWGVALTAAALGFAYFGQSAAKAAQQAADSQSAIDAALGSLAESGDRAAQASLKQRKLEEALKETYKSAEDAAKGMESAGFEIDAVAREIDALREEANNDIFKTGEVKRASDVIGGLLDRLKKGTLTVADFQTELEKFGRANNISPDLIENIKALTDETQFQRASQAAQYYKKQLDDLSRTSATNSRTDIFGSLDESQLNEVLNRAAIDKAIFGERISDIKAEEKKIADSLKEAITASGRTLSAAAQDYLNNQAAILTALDRVKKAAEAPLAKRPETPRGNIRKPGDFDPNIRNRKDVYTQAEVGDQLQKLRELRNQLAAVYQDLVNARAAAAGGIPLLEEAFGSTQDVQKVKAAIAAAKAQVTDLQAKVESGQTKSIQAYNQLEALRTALYDSGGKTDIIDQFIESAYDALAAIPKLKAEAASLETQLTQSGQAALVRKGPGNSVVKTNPYVNGAGTKPVLPPMPNAALPPAQQEQISVAGKIDQAKASLNSFIAEAQKLPEQFLQRRFFGDPVQYQAAAEQAKSQIDGLITKMLEGKVPAEDMKIAIREIVIGLADAGANSDALVPFVESLRNVLGSIDATITKVESLTTAMNKLATASREAGMGKGSSGSSTGSYKAPTYDLPKYANGGVFKVGGAGGTDSQLVKFMASPDETVAVFTPSQMRALDTRMSGGSGVSIQAPITIVASDAASFKASRRQVQMDLADAVQAAVNRTR